MFLVDSHCHIDMLNYKNIHKNLKDVIKKSFLQKVKFILAISSNLQSCKNILQQTVNYKNIACTCGIHPLNKDIYNFNKLIKLASTPRVIALGETGLDYIYNKYIKDTIHQKKLFRDHIRAGIILKKPIIIHNRNASTDLLNIIIEEKIERCGGIIHCFTENINLARKLLDIGLYISFSGIITFNKVEKIIKSLRFVPLDRLLIETDSPYLSPVPYRNKENQPAYLIKIAEFIAKIKNINIQYLSEITTRNFCNLFKIDVI